MGVCGFIVCIYIYVWVICDLFLWMDDVCFCVCMCGACVVDGYMSGWVY